MPTPIMPPSSTDPLMQHPPGSFYAESVDGSGDSTIADGDALLYDASLKSWKNAASGASGVTVGARASLPGTPSSGRIYKCTDSDYEYYGDGSKWNANVFGYRGIDPATDSAVVKKSTVSGISGSSSDTSAGGIKFTVGTHAGDHLEAWVRPVTASSTLAIALGFNQADGTTPQHGPCVYDSASGKWCFFRYAGGALYASRYLDSTGWVSNAASTPWVNPWPRRGVWGLTFASAAKLNFYSDSELLVPTTDIASGGGYSDSYLVGAFTHVGIAGNLGSANIWWQFLKIVRT